MNNPKTRIPIRIAGSAVLLLGLAGCGENSGMYEVEAPPEIEYEAPAETDSGDVREEGGEQPAAPQDY